MNIQLSVSAIQLQEYVVTASRGKREKITDAPAAISVISELKIRSESNPNLGDYFKNIKYYFNYFLNRLIVTSFTLIKTLSSAVFGNTSYPKH